MWIKSNLSPGPICGLDQFSICTSDSVAIPAGTTYGSVYYPNVAQQGVTIKVAKIPSQNPLMPVYQLEFSYGIDDLIYYDFSHENQGENPFFGDSRTLSANDPSCEVLHCAPGSESCDWYSCGYYCDANVSNCPITDSLVISANLCGWRAAKNHGFWSGVIASLEGHAGKGNRIINI